MLLIKTEVGKGLRRSDGVPDLAAVERSLAANIARHLGAAIRVRVEERADLAGQVAPEWDEEHKPKRVSARYPDAATYVPGESGGEGWRGRMREGKAQRTGAEYWPTSAAYHRANRTRRGTYHTTGGMWSGLSAVVYSAARADVLFRGRSEGQDARVIGGRSRPIKVSNALKAWTVYRMHGVNVLRPSEAELEAVRTATLHAVAVSVERTLAVTWQGEQPMRGSVERIFAAAFGVTPLKNASPE